MKGRKKFRPFFYGEVMQVTGELTTGAIGIMVTILLSGLAYWIKSDRQSTRFDVLIQQMKLDIETNRVSFTAQLTEMKGDARALGKSIDEVKLQLAAISAQQNMGNMFASFPDTVSRAITHAITQANRDNRGNRDRDAA